ncbi:ribonuclease [Caballeronia sp. LZ062]|uniref:ribonuclease n=1 Tax=unclassified Caballeronia TaxID=2646786 RepID=UPI00285DA7DA|nr:MULTISPECIES: ribonuclease [unclassified Caballeronia]MDR5857653.1 ribonuclease [Caballeronia sp. LZ050]MDR5869203.1 ribonuclease [Caballeronia sp. LZ062]
MLQWFAVVECKSTGDIGLVKRAWIFPCVIALSATLCGCGKNGSQNASQEPGAAASQAAAQASAASGVTAASGAQERGAVPAVARAQLPGEVADTLRLIKAGGPFPYKDDGVLFRNSAGLLPQQPRGYYHAYTVRTPGATDRGQRRIVCGGPRRQTGECYYTDDYYASFKRISE